jgi:hypothetical protein
MFTIKVAIIVANIPDQIRSGLFLMKRSIIAQAASVSPRKVRFSQIKGLILAAKELILINTALLVPRVNTRAKESRNIINNIRLILYGDFIKSVLINNVINA